MYLYSKCIWQYIYVDVLYISLFSRYANIYGVNVVEKIRTKSLVLMKQHKNEEIRLRAQKIYNALAD